MVGYLVAIFNNCEKLADASLGQIRVQKLDLTSVHEVGLSLKLVPTDLHGPGLELVLTSLQGPGPSLELDPACLNPFFEGLGHVSLSKT